MTKIGPATKVHSPNIPLHVRVVSPCQHGSWKPDLFHLAQDLIVDRQELHTLAKCDISPAFHTFVEDGVGLSRADRLLALRAAGTRGFHDFSAPLFDLPQTKPISFEHGFDDVKRGL